MLATLIFAFAVVVSSVLWTTPVCAEPGQPPRAFVVDLGNLEISRQAYLAGDRVTTVAVNRLLSDANEFLDVEPVSVVHSELIAPSGDPKDYVDYAAYWWPNPDTDDGLPWIRRDGHVNPDNMADFNMLQDLGLWTQSLSLAYYMTGDERYAEKTADLLRTWFTDPITGMNPRSEYGQMKPGWRIGDFNVAGFGNKFGAIFDAAGLIESSESWSNADKEALQSWTRDFSHWMFLSWRSELQRYEPANHGTNYDFIKTIVDLYSEDAEGALEGAERYFLSRMDGQVAEDGSNPLEMIRANNLLYHRYNLSRALDIATLTRNIPELDGLTHTTDDGRGLKLAIDFITPYFLGDAEWEFPGEEFPREPKLYFEFFRRAAFLYGDAEYYEAMNRIPITSYHYSDIIYPLAGIKINGDYDSDRVLTVSDIDQLARETRSFAPDIAFDLNGDQQVDYLDMFYWVEEFKNSVPGDANLDGVFDTKDLVDVMIAGDYESKGAADATWATGDWNGDGYFNARDFVSVLSYGVRFTREATPVAVPEPTGVAIWLAVVFGVVHRVSARRISAPRR